MIHTSRVIEALSVPLLKLTWYIEALSVPLLRLTWYITLESWIIFFFFQLLR